MKAREPVHDSSPKAVIPGVSLTVLRSFLLSKSTLVALSEPSGTLTSFPLPKRTFNKPLPEIV